MDVKQQVVFFTPRGKAIFDAPEGPEVLEGLKRLEIPRFPGMGEVRGAGVDQGAGENQGAGVDRGLGADQDGGVDQGLEADPPPRPSHLDGASQWTRDGDIPWEVEARVWDALD